MSTEKWNKQGRGRRRSGRSSSQSGGGPDGSSAKDRRPGLADWSDLNLSPPRFARFSGLVSKCEAAENVIAILKKFRRFGATLSERLRRGER